MGWIIFKYLVTAAIVVAVSEVAKRSDKLGALIVALPLVTILAMIWLYVEKQPPEKIASHAWYTFWYVVTCGKKFQQYKKYFHHYYTDLVFGHHSASAP